MAEADGIVLVHLRQISTKIDGLRNDAREIKAPLGRLEQVTASMSGTFDKIEMRLDRIERRLDLFEA